MLFLAIRHLTSRKRQTVFTLLGILLGTAAYVMISGMMLGFQSFIVDQLVNNDSHIRVSAREEPIERDEMQEIFYGDEAAVEWLVPPSGRRDNNFIQNVQGWLDRLEADPLVEAHSPQLNLQIIVTRGKISRAARLTGVDPDKQSRVTTIDGAMLEGKLEDVGKTGNRIVVGDGMLANLGARVGENIQLSAGKGQASPFKIVGKFHLGVKAFDDGYIYGALSDVQQLNRTPSQISDIAIRLYDVTRAAAVASDWDFLSGDKVQSWDQANEGILSVFRTQDIVRYSMTLSILIVAGFGIYNVLSMAVNNKRREIAVLRSMGFVPRDITNLFLYQGVILGALGGAIGLAIGFALCKYVSTIEVSPNRGLGGSHMIIAFFPSIYLRGFLLAFAASAAASYLPAHAAGRLSPIEIIRTENT